MIYTTTRTKKTLLIKIIKAIVIATFWILIWEAASRVVSRNNELLLLILPSPFTVLKKWWQIAFTKAFITAELFTLARIFLGFVLGFKWWTRIKRKTTFYSTVFISSKSTINSTQPYLYPSIL